MFLLERKRVSPIHYALFFKTTVTLPNLAFDSGSTGEKSSGEKRALNSMLKIWHCKTSKAAGKEQIRSGDMRGVITGLCGLSQYLVYQSDMKKKVKTQCNVCHSQWAFHALGEEREALFRAVSVSHRQEQIQRTGQKIGCY